MGLDQTVVNGSFGAAMSYSNDYWNQLMPMDARGFQPVEVNPMADPTTRIDPPAARARIFNVGAAEVGIDVGHLFGRGAHARGVAMPSVTYTSSAVQP